jgi:catechol 2,3-dioxygenase-like lactoylglutathione lyase family enzyme
MLTGFDHVTIIVADLEAALERYTALLGAQPTWRGEHREMGTRAALFGLDNALVELVAPIPDALEGEGMRALIAARGEGLYAIAFSCDDADATFSSLRARGVRVAPPAEGEADDGAGGTRRYRTLELSARATRGLSVLAVERADTVALRGRMEDRASAHALDHVVVQTAAPEAAIALYGEGLGVRLALDKELGKTRMLFFRIGGVTLEVVHDASAGEQDAFYGLAYRVADIEAAHARLGRLGFPLSEIKPGNKPGTRVFTVRAGSSGVPTLVLCDPSRTRSQT